MNKERDIHYMRRALELAQRGLGAVSPNPMVGCVIVHDDTIIAEGWHQQYGEQHAEVNAINRVEDKSMLKEAAAYVTLEPCAHYGKTPPCAELLVSHRLKRVVIANQDPFLVDGSGIQKLREAGIEVEIGTLDKEGIVLNRRFFTSIEKKRPYVILKWAQTADGFTAREDFDSKWISNEYSRKLVHKWRAEEDAILVGTNTARYDNPSLSVRDWQGRHPLRLVLDKQLDLKRDLSLFDQSIPTVCYNLLHDSESENLTLKKLDDGAVVEGIVNDLHERKIQSLMVEGGSTLIDAFINKGLWDEARVFTSQHCFGSGIDSPKLSGEFIHDQEIKGDQLRVFRV